MPRGNGKTSSNNHRAAADEDSQTPMALVCRHPQDRDAPCPICNGKGVITLEVPLDDRRYGKFQRCPNNPLDTDYELHERLRRYGNLQAQRDKTFENFRTNPFQGQLSDNAVRSLETALRQAEDFARQPQGWIVYEGPYGCGKTHLAVAIANARLEQYGDLVLFITAPDLLDFLRTTYSPQAELSYDESFDRIRSIPMLVLDDLGVENPSAWSKEKLFQLLNYRYIHALPTVITTNTSLDELDPRISSRMMEKSVVRHIQIKAPDYRKLRRPNNEDRHFSNLPLYHRMYFDTFSTESPWPEEAARLKLAREVAVKWAARSEDWLYLMGDFGSGKTHLAAAIANDLHDRGQEVMFTTVPDLLDYLRLAFSPQSHVHFGKRFYEILNAPILILDDLRLASATAWAQEKLFQIIDYRYVARLPTVITSSEMMKNMDERVATRLMDRRICLPFDMKVRSYVKRQKKQP